MAEVTKAGIATEEAERVVVSWVAEILEDDNVTPDDNFLDLGGHSMLALELSRKSQERFGAEFNIQVLFENSLGEATADVLRRATAR
jgi:acyl carrier protein